MRNKGRYEYVAGLIIRHVEYLVKSERFRSEVIRRYSDFQVINTFTACRTYFSVLYEKVSKFDFIVQSYVRSKVMPTTDFS
jgi:hypothetical protein